MKQPFPNGSKVRCIRKSPDVWIDGKVIGDCYCSPNSIFEIESMLWSSVIGWLIVTPKPHETLWQEFHMACDFELVD